MATLSSSRRRFVKTLAAGAAGATVGLPAASYARILGANERVAMGLIGTGRMARGHLDNLLKEPDADVVALCDVYRTNLDYVAAKAPGARTVEDFRAVLDRQDIDAVLVATPDHWHALPTILACEAGKDVYVEKPASHTIAEGRKMVEAARQHNRVVQVGTQQRSDEHFQYAAELVRSGTLGPVSFVRTWNYSNDLPDGIGSPPDGSPPPGLNWELWLGPSPKVPYNPNRFGVALDEAGDYTRWATWRYFWDQGGGLMTDWGVHLLDIVQLAMGVDFPESVAAMGGRFYVKDNRDTPDTLQVTYQYPGFLCTYENRVCNGHPLEGQGYGITFHGAAGTLFVNRGGFEVMPEADSDLVPMSGKGLGGGHAKHVRNFLDCVKSRQQPIADVEIGHRSTSTAILGNIAYQTGRTVRWEGAREEIVGDDEASRLLAADYRAPWTL